MRTLPEEDNPKQDPGGRIEMPARGGPADDWRCSARNGTDEGAERRDPFQRRTQEQVADERKGRQQSREGIGRDSQVRDTGNGEANPVTQATRTSDPARPAR